MTEQIEDPKINGPQVVQPMELEDIDDDDIFVTCMPDLSRLTRAELRDLLQRSDNPTLTNAMASVTRQAEAHVVLSKFNSSISKFNNAIIPVSTFANSVAPRPE